MGTSGSRNCKANVVNPDYLTVITFTDSLVQKLPLDSDSSSALAREAREQNIDDYWRDRMDCLENTFMESMGLTEKRFSQMEQRILGMSPPIYKLKCPLNVLDVERCLVSSREDPLSCNKTIKKLLMCIDTTAQDEARRASLKAARDNKKKKCER